MVRFRVRVGFEIGNLIGDAAGAHITMTSYACVIIQIWEFFTAVGIKVNHTLTQT